MTSEEKAERQYLRRVVLEVLLVIFAVVLFVAFTKSALAEPIASVTDGGISVTIYTEQCAFPKEVTNLSNRATWVQDGKTMEGCVGYEDQLGIVVFWFADKTAIAMPVSMFTKVTGA